MEHDVNRWFAVPWHDCRKAVACAIELARLVMPPPSRSRFAGFAGRNLASGGGPYRTSLICEHDDHADADVLAAARCVEYALQFAQSYVDDTIEEWATSDDDYDGGCVISWIYRAAGEHSEDAWRAGYASGDPSWQVAGEIAQTACMLVQKWAANSTGGGAVPNDFLERAVSTALDRGAADYDVVSALACKWRFRDALGDAVSTEDLRLAFEAAWNVGAYDFAYSLCDLTDPNADDSTDPT